MFSQYHHHLCRFVEAVYGVCCRVNYFSVREKKTNLVQKNRTQIYSYQQIEKCYSKSDSKMVDQQEPIADTSSFIVYPHKQHSFSAIIFLLLDVLSSPFSYLLFSLLCFDKYRQFILAIRGSQRGYFVLHHTFPLMDIFLYKFFQFNCSWGLNPITRYVKREEN